MTGSEPTGIGIIGAGNISSRYLSNLITFPALDVRFVADIITDRARVQAEKYGVPGWGTVEELLADRNIRIVINLSPPQAHVDVSLRCLNAGKHVWSEKPFAVDREEGQRLLEAAHRRGLRVASAPDTFLGPGIQTARRLIEAGQIGQVTAAVTAFQSPGPESWHPDPEFLFQAGAGPLLDMGPYYVTALVQLFGPAARVTAVARMLKPVRLIGSGPRAGTPFEVTVPTFVSATIEFESGQVSQSILTFDSKIKRAQFEVYGSDGTISIPDPDTFGGDVGIYADNDNVKVIPTGKIDNGRGRGVVELAQAIREGRPEQASGAQAFHVIDILISISEAAESGDPVAVNSSFDLAPGLPQYWDPRVGM